MSNAPAPKQLVRVDLGQRSYEIVVQPGALLEAGKLITDWVTGRTSQAAARSALVVTDDNVRGHAEQVLRSLSTEGWRLRLYCMRPGEPSKCQQVISDAYDALVEMKADRGTVVVAVGGGVVGDAAGFVAATFARGIPFVQVPTTLLADVDSSVGGKVGINHPRAKNLIGAFHQPLGVLVDPEVLSTLPAREYASGLAEVAKYGVILDAAFFTWLEDHRQKMRDRDPTALQYAIARSCRLKADVVEQDEYETSGLRAILNYGHTFAHAFEALTGYGELLHGEAVALGMVCASRLAERLERIAPDLTQRQLALLRDWSLPVDPGQLAGKLSIDAVLDRMRLDKKSLGGELRFVLPSRMGHVELVPGVPEESVRDVLMATGLR